MTYRHPHREKERNSQRKKLLAPQKKLDFFFLRVRERFNELEGKIETCYRFGRDTQKLKKCIRQIERKWHS
jgi:hypothetical protein